MSEYDLSAGRANMVKRRQTNPHYVDRQLALACLEQARQMLTDTPERDALMMVRDAIWALGGDSFPEG